MRPLIAFDLNRKRLAELERGVDRTLEASSEELDAATLVRYSAEPAEAGGSGCVHRDGADAGE